MHFQGGTFLHLTQTLKQSSSLAADSVQWKRVNTIKVYKLKRKVRFIYFRSKSIRAKGCTYNIINIISAIIYLTKLNSTLNQRSWPLKNYCEISFNQFYENKHAFVWHWNSLCSPLLLWHIQTLNYSNVSTLLVEIWGFKIYYIFIPSSYFLIYIQCQATPFLLIIYLCHYMYYSESDIHNNS